MVILGNRFYGSSWEFWLLGSSGYFLIWTPGRSGHTVQFLFTVNGKSVCHVRSCSLLDHAPPTHKEPKKLKRDTWLKWLNKGLIMSVTAPPPPHHHCSSESLHLHTVQEGGGVYRSTWFIYLYRLSNQSSTNTWLNPKLDHFKKFRSWRTFRLKWQRLRIHSSTKLEISFCEFVLVVTWTVGLTWSRFT